ncbi:MAG: hypothetical protein LBF75_10700 [Treponema sp.]|jgi:hypothetical protein|nr:hypothetical protein [Treponema sp.]
MKKATSFKVGIITLVGIYGFTLALALEAIITIGPFDRCQLSATAAP